jgi:hypothetical protein
MLGYLYGEKFCLEPERFPYKYPNILIPSHFSYLSSYEDGTDRGFRNAGI